MSDDKKDDPLGSLLGEELGEWDAMFDSLHETVAKESEAASAPETLAQEPGFDIEQAAKTPFVGLPDSGASVDEIAAGAQSSPFEGDADELSELLGAQPESLGGLLGSGPIRSKRPTTEAANLQAPSALQVREGQESLARSGPIGPDDAALDDFGRDPTLDRPSPQVSRSKAAEAFFEDESVSLELDDDFYEGIEVQEVAQEQTSTGVQALAHTVRRTPSNAEEAEIEVSYQSDGVPVEAPDSVAPSGSSLAEAGVGPSKGAPAQEVTTETSVPMEAASKRADSEDGSSLDLALDDALNDLRTPVAASTNATTTDPVRARELDGAVEMAFEDAVAMSTGTLLTGPRLEDADVEPDLPPAKFSTQPPGPDLGAIQVQIDVGVDTNDRTEEHARLLVLYEQELSLLDQVAPTIRMRLEAGRIAEALGDLEQARHHFDEALKFDPHLVSANRALRRIEQTRGNWHEVARLIDNEIQRASSTEVDALKLCRVSLLMALDEHDMARVAVGDLLDTAPSDVRALLANLELAFVDERREEFAAVLDALAAALSEPALVAATLDLSAALAEQAGDGERAERLFQQSSELYSNIGVQLSLRSSALANGSATVANHAATAATAEASTTLRAALQWQRTEVLLREGDTAGAQGLLGPASPAEQDYLLLLQRSRACMGSPGLLQDALLQVADHEEVTWGAQALAQAAGSASTPRCEHIYAKAFESHPDDTYLYQQRRWSQERHRDWDSIYAGDLHHIGINSSARAQSRYVQSAIQSGNAAATFAALQEESMATPGSFALQIAKTDLAFQLNAQEYLSNEHGLDAAHGTEFLRRSERQGCRALTRIAIAQVASMAAQSRAIDAWARLSEAERDESDAPEYALQLAGMLGDTEILQAQAERAFLRSEDPVRRAEIAVERSGSLFLDAKRAADLLLELQNHTPSRRGAQLHWVLALSSGDLPAASARAEAEAIRLEENEDLVGADCWLYRAAFLRVQEDTAPTLAAPLLERIAERRPDFGAAIDLLQISNTDALHSSHSTSEGQGKIAHEQASSRMASLRRAEMLARTGDLAGAAEAIALLRERHTTDPVVIYTFDRICWQAGADSSSRLADYALKKLRLAEEQDDAMAKSLACEELARIDGELRGEFSSAMMFWEAASTANPEQQELSRTLQRELATQGQADSEAMHTVLGRVISSMAPGEECGAYFFERARLARKLNFTDSEVQSDYANAFGNAPECRLALFHWERSLSEAGPSNALAEVERTIASYFEDAPRAQAAFLVRSGETLRNLERHEEALESFRLAADVKPGFAPALFAWRDVALDYENWDALAEACLLEARNVESERARKGLYHLAGVTLMDKAGDSAKAALALQQVLTIDPEHQDAFVRLRRSYSEGESWKELAQLYSMRLQVETSDGALCEIHRSLATVFRDSLSDPGQALQHFQAILALRPDDPSAVVAVSELAWQLEHWATAADTLLTRARTDTSTAAQIDIFGKLATIYTEHIPEPEWAMKSLRKVIGIDPSNRQALEKLADVATESGDYRLALGACEQLIKGDPPIPEKIDLLRRMAKAFVDGFGDTNKAERALRVALDLDMTSDAALDSLIEFYTGNDNVRSAQVHIDRVCNAMRLRLRESAADCEAYRVLARASKARAETGSREYLTIAQAAASVAVLLGELSDEVAQIAATTVEARAIGLATTELDDFLFSSDVQTGVLPLLSLLGERLTKHIGADIRNHGVGRSDRLSDSEHSFARLAKEQSVTMGSDKLDVYIAKQAARTLAGEPTRPLSLIVGRELSIGASSAELRFLAGRIIKLLAENLCSPLQLGQESFGVLLVGLLRQFQPEFAAAQVDESAATAEQQRLRRLIPSSMLRELSPYASALANSDFDHNAIWHQLTDAGNRAGLLCASDTKAVISALMRHKAISDAAEALKDKEIAALVKFACSQEHAALYLALEP